MEGGPRSNSSSGMINIAQICIPTMKVTFIEAPSDRDMPHKHTRRKRTQKYLRKNYYHRIKCTAATFLVAFMWRRHLSSAVLATTTHKEPEKVFDKTYTQVRAQMINKWRMKRIQRELYNVRHPS